MAMGVEIALICLEFAIVLAFAPLKISICGHISLARLSLQLDARVFSLRALRLRARVKDGKLVCTLNGKKPPKRRMDAKRLKKLPKNIDECAVIVKGRTLMKIGGEEAMSSAIASGAIMSAIAPIDQGGAVYMSANESFEVDIEIKTKLNLLQALYIAL